MGYEISIASSRPKRRGSIYNYWFGILRHSYLLNRIGKWKGTDGFETVRMVETAHAAYGWVG